MLFVKLLEVFVLSSCIIFYIVQSFIALDDLWFDFQRSQLAFRCYAKSLVRLSLRNCLEILGRLLYTQCHYC